MSSGVSLRGRPPPRALGPAPGSPHPPASSVWQLRHRASSRRRGGGEASGALWASGSPVSRKALPPRAVQTQACGSTPGTPAPCPIALNDVRGALSPQDGTRVRALCRHKPNLGETRVGGSRHPNPDRQAAGCGHCAACPASPLQSPSWSEAWASYESCTEEPPAWHQQQQPGPRQGGPGAATLLAQAVTHLTRVSSPISQEVTTTQQPSIH